MNVLDVLILYLYNLYKVHESLGLTWFLHVQVLCPHHLQHAWRLSHAHVQSLSLHGNHPWFKSPNINFSCFCTWPAFSKATSFPHHKLLEGLIFPFTFRCTIHLEIILTYGVRYEGGGSVSSLQRISNWPTWFIAQCFHCHTAVSLFVWDQMMAHVGVC